MKRYLIALPVSVFASAALAHTSAVPHVHPHMQSALPGLDVFILAVLAAGLLCLALAKLKRGGRS